MTERYTEVTEATIGTLVDVFYVRVHTDPTLGPVFANAIADNAWPAYLDKMYAVWSSVMLTSGCYKGNPVSIHRGVVNIAPPMFDHWLDRFETSATGLFIPELAERFASAARRISESLKLALFFRPDCPWLEDLRRRQIGEPACV